MHSTVSSYQPALRRVLAAALALFLASVPAVGVVRLPALLSEGMVLQRDTPVRLWGTASPTEKVTVEFRDKRVETVADAAGRWQVSLPAMPAGGPHSLTVKGENVIVLNDVMTGDVWIASGQSNMRWTVAQSDDAAQEIPRANHPGIRFFQVPQNTSPYPQADIPGAWRRVTPQSVGGFSGVGYYFARRLHEEKQVPIGIIQASYGNTPIQAWTRREMLEGDPLLAVYFERWEKILAAYPEAARRYADEMRTWRGKAAQARQAGETPPAPPAPPPGPGYYTAPAGLFNAMIAPLTLFTIRGFIWYQGESSTAPEDARLYQRLFANLITDWRQQWQLGDLPFVFAQLSIDRGRNLFPEVREAQRETLRLRNTAMVVTIDVGEPIGQHPGNKKSVGERFAKAARALAYGENLVYSGPLFRRSSIEGRKLRLWFDHVGAGLEARDGQPLQGFVLAGADHSFHVAQAVIENDTVVLSSEAVAAPVAARYAWVNDARPANLVNHDGLPASPFRTDDWQVVALPANLP